MSDWLRQQLISVSQEFPDRLAVDGGKAGQLTYRELYGLASAISEAVAAHGSVGILSNRRPEAYVAVLACYLGGIPFTPLNPKFPEERLRKIIELSDVSLVLHDTTTTGLADELGAAAHAIDLYGIQSASAMVEVSEDAIAYRMFTSGSTGEPKGVPIPVSALTHYVRAIGETLSLPDEGRYSQLFDLSFDLSIHDIFVTFANGGTLVPANEINLLMPHTYIAKQQIDVWFSVPMLAMSAARGLAGTEPAHCLKLALFCGEALPMDYVRGFRDLMEDGAPLWNLYGPTEATIAFTAKLIDPSYRTDGVATLGDAFGDNEIAILDETGTVQPVSEGATGELLLAGPQVFAGYQPPRHDPFVEGRYYRSGDIVTYRNGELEYEGRKDNQVKIRGMRIELSEIESAFRNHLDCDSAAAIVHGELEDAEIRVAYTAPGELADTKGLEKHLPSYMIPARIWRLDELPVNANGKVDRRKLGEIEWPSPD